MLKGKTALVTGSTSGIGLGVATELARQGANIVLNGFGDVDGPRSQLQALGVRVGYHSADMSRPNEIAGMMSYAEREFGGVDVVVNAAGRMALAPLADLDLAEFDAIQRTNVRGAFVVAQQGARRVRGGGSIVVFSTSVLGLAFPGYSAYAASKGAVEALPLILARELRGRDVTVNTVAPGPTDTPLFTEGKPQELIDRVAAANPFERLGTPDDIARSVSFLAGPDGRWINGQTLYANGGAA